VRRSFWVWFELQANRSATTRNSPFGRTPSARIAPHTHTHKPSPPRLSFCSNELLLRLWWCCLVTVEWTQPSKVARVNGFSVLGDRDTVGPDRCLISPASLSCLLWANKADGEVKESDCWDEKVVVQQTADSFTATDSVSSWFRLIIYWLASAEMACLFLLLVSEGYRCTLAKTLCP